MENSQQKIEEAIEYAEKIISVYLDDTIYMPKEDLKKQLYWAFYNGMSTQKKIDINKLL